MSKLDVLAHQLEVDKKRIAYLEKIIADCEALIKMLSGHYHFVSGDPKITIRASGTLADDDCNPPMHREVEIEILQEEEKNLFCEMVRRKKDSCLAEKDEIEKKYEGWN